jgi:hypothetical protein
MKYRRKKIFVTQDKTKYVWCYLFDNKSDLNEYYKNSCKERGVRFAKVLGVSLHYAKWMVGDKKATNETGKVLLSKDTVGGALVAHEFTHACMWAFKHHLRKKQYPFVIRNGQQEEDFIRGQSVAIKMFWNWYYKIEKA